MNKKRNKENRNKTPIDKRKKSALGILIILFSFFSFFNFVEHKEDKEKDNNNDIKNVEEKKSSTRKINNQNKNTVKVYDDSSDINENITTEMKGDLKEKINIFFQAYLNNTQELRKRLDNITDITTVNLYESLKNELETNRYTKNKNYYERVVKEIKINSYEAVNDGSIIINVEVHSEWINKDKKHTDNENMEYNVQFVNEEGVWKITDLG